MLYILVDILKFLGTKFVIYWTDFYFQVYMTTTTTKRGFYDEKFTTKVLCV